MVDRIRDGRMVCTCLGTCLGAERLGPGWVCAIVAPLHEPYARIVRARSLAAHVGGDPWPDDPRVWGDCSAPRSTRDAVGRVASDG